MLRSFVTGLFAFMAMQAASAVTPITPAHAAWSVSGSGFGPVKIGFTPEQAAKALGMTLTSDREAKPGECHYLVNKQKLVGVFFMVVEDKIVRVDVDAGTWRTAAGAHLGTTEAELKTLYPAAEMDGHPYVETGHYFNISRAEDDAGLVFETDGKAVTEFRGGKFGAIQWIEGCE